MILPNCALFAVIFLSVPTACVMYNSNIQNNMILSCAGVYSGLWILLNAKFLRQAPHRAFCFAFCLSARGITISSTNLCLLISHQTQRLLRLTHGFSASNLASTLEMFLSHTRKTFFIYALNILISL